MRKLTYTEAATLNEKFKVRVTPEQSEKMQRAWFAAGKTWQHGNTEVLCKFASFLFLRDVLTMTVDEFLFVNSRNEEVELIDDIPKKCADCGKTLTAEEIEYLEHTCSDCEEKSQSRLNNSLPQHDFASQQDVTLWVAQGNKAKHMENDNIVGFKDGVLWDFTENRKCHWQFLDFDKWQKHTPPRLIRVNDVEVPAPLESLEGVEVVYLPNIGNPQEPIEYTSSFVIKKGLPLDICYANKEDAIARAEAMRIFEVTE